MGDDRYCMKNSLKKELRHDPQAPHLPNTPWAFVIYFLGFYKWPLVAMFVFEMGQALCQILVPYAIRQLIDTGSSLTGSLSVALQTLKPALFLFVALSLGVLFFSRASGGILVMTGPALRRRVRRTVFNYLQFHSQRFFISNFSGSLANRISEISQAVNHSTWTVLFDFWPVVISFSASMYLMYTTHTTLAMAFGVWTIIYIVVSFLLAKRCQKYAKAHAATRSTLSGKIVDAVTNSLNTKIFAKLGFERSYLDNYLDLEVKAARKTYWFMEAMRWFQFLSTMLLQIGVIVLALRFWVMGEISVGQFAMITSLALVVINDARGLSRRFLEFFEYMGNISDGVNIIVRNHEIIDAKDAKPIKIKQGEINFDQVNFAYTSEKPVFERLNVSIKSGQRVGLVGFSGSGKTTFINLLLRMYEVNSGQILLDGQNIAKCTQDSLREQVSMIPQEPMLFHRTLLENIRYGKLDASDEEVYAAAKAAKAHDFIVQLPEGYKALVGERGVKLSGGQRQRIAIARAILKNARILVLDEATSSLDSVTEKAIQESFDTLMQGRTVVVVAHRLSTIANLDRIIVFHEGKIIEDGSHDELLKQKGHYAKLWSMQAGGFLPQHDS